ncbi:hypothetical protein BB560_006773 [Smittium megazygosporum]|uniref:Uncharacterized protein n=1 Tax=Smittium megazygosporum TaxID=133381 RepID=A0A2T9Y1U6_9FUNG|nr:hypothetical protein BB560_006773 [Smittium megazygosporum]
MNGIVDVSTTFYFNYDGYLNESGIYENVLFDLYDPTKLQAFDPLNFERYAKERAT